MVEVDIANLIITSILTIVIIIVTILLGVTQNRLQKKDQNISLFEKRYEVYLIFSEIVSNTEFLKKISSSDNFSEQTNIDIPSAFRDFCVNKIFSKTGEKIKVLNNLKEESKLYASPRKDILMKIDILNQEILFTALSELHEKILILNRSEFLFEKEISEKIIKFSKIYQSVLEYSIINQNDKFEENYTELIFALDNLETHVVLNKIKKLLNLNKKINN